MNPPVSIRALRLQEYPEFEDQAVVMYAEQSARAGRVGPAEALEWARRETRKLLPDGFRTPNHLFYVVELPGPLTVGYIWCGREPKSEEKGFLYTILVFEGFRGRGIGARALELMEAELRARGLRSVGLHVYAFNEAAIRLYRRLGYRDVSLIMSREL